MKKTMVAALLAGSLSLTACASVDDARMSDVGTGAAIGAAGGAALGAAVGGVGVLEGAVVGAAIGGLAGAVWSDSNNDGYADGYTYNGQGDRTNQSAAGEVLTYTLDLAAGLTQVLAETDGSETTTYLYGNARLAQHARIRTLIRKREPRDSAPQLRGELG